MSEIVITRNELYELAWSEPMLTLSKKYAISDNGLRKVCVGMNIPLPKAGYWMKLKAGKKVSKQYLPEANDVKTEVKLRMREEGETYNNSEYSEFKQICNEVKTLIKVNNLNPSEKLSTNDPLIITAKQSLSEKKKAYGFEGLITTGNNTLRIEVSVTNVNRALRFMDFFIKVVRLRGHDIEANSQGTYVIINSQDGEDDENIKIIFREKCKRVLVKNGNWEHSVLHANDILYFKSDGYHSGEWVEGKKQLEDQIPNMIAKWELSVKELHRYHKESRARREEVEAMERKAKELKERKEKELVDFKCLLDESARWQKAKILRSYLETLERKAIETNTKSHEFDAWFEWAKKKANWYDPMIESSDELLKNIDMERLVFKMEENENRLGDNNFNDLQFIEKIR